MKFPLLVFIHVFVCVFFIHETPVAACLRFSLMEKMCQALHVVSLWFLASFRKKKKIFMNPAFILSALKYSAVCPTSDDCSLLCCTH